MLVASPSFTVDLNPRLGSILRFRSTVNEASFDLGVAVVLVGGIIRGEPMWKSPHSTALGAGFGDWIYMLAIMDGEVMIDDRKWKK